MDEIWKPIPECPGYEVSNKGRVRSFFRKSGQHTWEISDEPQRVLSQCTSGKYPYVNVKDKTGARGPRKVHELVALAFLGPCPPGLEVCHNDNDSQNNNVENLRYDTHKNNVREYFDDYHVYAHEKFTAAEVRAIRERRSRGETCSSIAEEFGTHHQMISGICQGRVRRNAGGPITKREYKITLHDADEIRRLRSRGKSLIEIGEMFDISPSYVSYISNGKRKLRKDDQ